MFAAMFRLEGIAMPRNVTVVERAFEIAQEGQCHCVSEIARRLTDEGYDMAYQHLSSPSLKIQLRKLMTHQ
jgi:hypothetical protein